jgi:hypothetical protein
MGNWRRVAGLVMSGALAAAPGCAIETTKTCSLVGCQDQFSANLQTADGSFPSGTHQVDVVADGLTLSCAFSFPLGTAPGGGTIAPSCPMGLNVGVWPATVCTSTTTGATASQTCDPIPGHFVESITLTGAPTRVQLQQSVDGTSLLNVEMAPTYVVNRPNGPDCDPACRQSSASLTLN